MRSSAPGARLVIGDAIRKPGERGSGGAAYAFIPAVAYICSKACEIVLRNFMSTNWRNAAADMVRTAEINSRVQRPFYHLVLSWHPDERPKRKDQIAAMEMMLERLGLEEHQVVIGSHDDCYHLHVHAAINTVHPASGKVCSKNTTTHGLRTPAVQSNITSAGRTTTDGSISQSQTLAM